MATCPNCGRFLDDEHKCVGVWRLRLGVLRTTLLGGLVGALAGWLIVEAAFGDASWAAIALAGVIGMITVRSLLRGEPPQS